MVETVAWRPRMLCGFDAALAARRSVVLGLALLGASTPIRAELRVSPQTILLDNPEATQQLLVTHIDSNSRAVDRTRQVTYETSAPRLVRVDATGLVQPLGEG